MAHMQDTLIRLFTTMSVLLLASVARGDVGEYVLIQNGLESQRIRLVEVSDETLVHLQNGLWVSVDLDQCIALFNTTEKPKPARDGLLILTDGQRFPGEAKSSIGHKPASSAICDFTELALHYTR